MRPQVRVLYRPPEQNSNENLFFWWKGFFVLPRLISRPQEGSGEECGRVSDWGFSSPNFVFRFAKCVAEKFDRESLISYTYNISYMRNSANNIMTGKNDLE